MKKFTILIGMSSVLFVALPDLVNGECTCTSTVDPNECGGGCFRECGLMHLPCRPCLCFSAVRRAVCICIVPCTYQDPNMCSVHSVLIAGDPLPTSLTFNFFFCWTLLVLSALHTLSTVKCRDDNCGKGCAAGQCACKLIGVFST